MERDEPMNAVRFWQLAAGVKTEARRGWTEVSGIKRIESVADHSFGVAVLALLEAGRRRYDLERTLKLALIHDLEEAMTGDLTPGDKRILGSRRVLHLKRVAVSEILKLLPSSRRVEYRALWNDLATGRTREARLVKDLDRLEMACQARRYESLGVAHGQMVRFYSSAVRRIKDPALKKTARRLARGGDLHG